MFCKYVACSFVSCPGYVRSERRRRSSASSVCIAQILGTQPSKSPSRCPLTPLPPTVPSPLCLLLTKAKIIHALRLAKFTHISRPTLTGSYHLCCLCFGSFFFFSSSSPCCCCLFMAYFPYSPMSIKINDFCIELGD